MDSRILTDNDHCVRLTLTMPNVYRYNNLDDKLMFSTMSLIDAGKFAVPNDQHMTTNINETKNVLRWIRTLMIEGVPHELFVTCTHNATVDLIFWDDQCYLHAINSKMYPDTLDIDRSVAETAIKKYNLQQNNSVNWGNNNVKIYDIAKPDTIFTKLRTVVFEDIFEPDLF